MRLRLPFSQHRFNSGHFSSLMSTMGGGETGTQRQRDSRTEEELPGFDPGERCTSHGLLHGPPRSPTLVPASPSAPVFMRTKPGFQPLCAGWSKNSRAKEAQYFCDRCSSSRMRLSCQNQGQLWHVSVAAGSAYCLFVGLASVTWGSRPPSLRAGHRLFGFLGTD